MKQESNRKSKILDFCKFRRTVAEYLHQRCDEEGISIVYKSPYKTSQRCADCGKIERSNRKGNKFKCVACGVERDADFNASLNLEYLGYAGEYSLRTEKI